VAGIRGTRTRASRREAARGWGLPLRGVRLDLASERLRSPALVHLAEPVHGHFVVIRPVGRSGTLVQVLDPNRAPYVMERSELVKLPGWTGLALVPERPVEWTRVAGVALLVAGLGLAAWGWRRGRGRGGLSGQARNWIGGEEA
jgi:hypothetical protein